LTSYPYLKIAREHGVDYGAVLSFLDAYKKQFNNMTYWERRAVNKIQSHDHTATGSGVKNAIIKVLAKCASS